tara:strand:+ start:278 stop:391 length:114 start_codon:yes stop_codon:yes gene_type:complete
MKDLELMGINAITLFPSLEGVCRKSMEELVLYGNLEM